MSGLEIAWNGFVNAIVEVCSDVLPDYRVDHGCNDERDEKLGNHLVSGLRSNETQDERRRTRARVARSESAEVISKVERTAVRRSLHRLVRSLV